MINKERLKKDLKRSGHTQKKMALKLWIPLQTLENFFYRWKELPKWIDRMIFLMNEWLEKKRLELRHIELIDYLAKQCTK